MIGRQTPVFQGRYVINTSPSSKNRTLQLRVFIGDPLYRMPHYSPSVRLSVDSWLMRYKLRKALDSQVNTLRSHHDLPAYRIHVLLGSLTDRAIHCCTTIVSTLYKLTVRHTWPMKLSNIIMRMRPMYGRPENFHESLTTPTATFPEFLMGFCSY